MIKRWWWLFGLMLVVGPSIGFWIGKSMKYFEPQMYETSAVIEVPPSASQPPFTAVNVMSPEILSKVVARMDFCYKWNVAERTAINRLQQMLRAEQVFGTQVITIKVRSDSRYQNESIAEQLFGAIRDFREEQKPVAQILEFVKFVETVREQETKVSDLRKTISAMRDPLQLEKPSAGSKRGDSALFPEFSSPGRYQTQSELQDEEQKLQQMQSEEKERAQLLRPNDVIMRQGAESIVAMTESKSPAPLYGAIGGLLISPLIAFFLIKLFGRFSTGEAPMPREWNPEAF